MPTGGRHVGIRVFHKCRLSKNAAVTAVLTMHICLEPAALLRVLDRLVVQDLLPNTLHFQHCDGSDATLQLQWDDMIPSKAANLRDRLAQMPAVCEVGIVESAVGRVGDAGSKKSLLG